MPNLACPQRVCACVCVSDWPPAPSHPSQGRSRSHSCDTRNTGCHQCWFTHSFADMHFCQSFPVSVLAPYSPSSIPPPSWHVCVLMILLTIYINQCRSEPSLNLAGWTSSAATSFVVPSADVQLPLEVLGYDGDQKVESTTISTVFRALSPKLFWLQQVTRSSVSHL